MEQYIPLLIVGPPRSGTTWIGKILSASPGAQYLHEPDNEKNNFLAFIRKNKLRRFPYFKDENINNSFINLFHQAFYKTTISQHSRLNSFFYKYYNLKPHKTERILQSQGFLDHEISDHLWIKKLIHYFGDIKKQKSKKRIVKSVHSLLSIPYLLKHLSFRPLYVFRHPASMVSSYINLKMPDGNRLNTIINSLDQVIEFKYIKQIQNLNTETELMGAQVGLFHYFMSRFIQENNIDYIFYENITQEPYNNFKYLYEKYDLEWTKKPENLINEYNKKGQGYKTERLLKKQKEIWKERLTNKQIQEIEKGYSIFPNNIYRFS